MVVNGFEVESAIKAWFAEQRLHFAGKEKAFVGICEVKRLYSHAITSDENAPLSRVPDGESELPVQLRKHHLAIAQIKIEQNFRVTSAAELEAIEFETLPQILIIKNLTIEYGAQSLGLVPHRLVT